MIVKYTPPDADDGDTISVQEIDYATGYRRPRAASISNDIDDLPDRVLDRLWLARQLAVMRAMGYELKTRT